MKTSKMAKISAHWQRPCQEHGNQKTDKDLVSEKHFRKEVQVAGFKKCWKKRKFNDLDTQYEWNSCHFKRKKHEQKFPARVISSQSSRVQYIIALDYMDRFSQNITKYAYKISTIMVNKVGSKSSRRTNKNATKKGKQNDSIASNHDNDPPLSELKKRQSVQKKSRKSKVKAKRGSRKVVKAGGQEKKASVPRGKRSSSVKRTKESVCITKESDKTTKSKTSVDPREVPLPDDSSQISDLSDQLQKTSFEREQEAVTKEIDEQYKQVMTRRSMRKGDVYKDQNGRLTTKGEEVTIDEDSSHDSNSTVNTNEFESQMEVDEENGSVQESTKNAEMTDRESVVTNESESEKVDSEGEEGKEDEAVESYEGDEKKDQDKDNSSWKRSYAQVVQVTPQITPEKEDVMEKTDAQLLDEFIQRPRQTVQQDEESDAGTVVQGNQKKKSTSKTIRSVDNTKEAAPRPHTIFCKCKIKVPESDTPTAKMRKQLQVFLTTMIKVDRTMVLYEYKDRSCKRYINHPSKIPERPSKMKSYFDGGFRPASKGVDIWPQIKIGITTDPETFIADLRSLLEDLEMTVFMKDIQAEETETIGYFLFSHGKQDRNRLKNTIEYHLKERYNIRERVSVRWQKIQNSSKKEKNENTAVKAFHIEVVKGQGIRVGRGIAKLYSSRMRRYPDNEKMRFIRYKTGNQHSTEVATFKDIANKQNWFTQLTAFATTYEVASLDEKYDGLEQSLRGYIMGMTHSNGQKLFLTVDWNWNQSAVLLVFPSTFSDEARDRIADLASFMRFTAGDRALLKFFTPEAAERAVHSPWDNELGRAVSEEANEFNDILQEAGQIDWLQPQDEQVEIQYSAEENTDKVQRSLFPFTPNDDSSLPSLGTYDQSTGKRDSIQEQGSVKKQKKDESSVEELTENSDEQTMYTLSTRMDDMNQSQVNFQNDMNNKFNMIMNLLQGREHSSEDVTHEMSETPVPREGTGAAL